MKLQIRSILEPGNLSKERVTFRALTDLNLGDYLIAQTGLVENDPSTDLFHTFWFPYQEIEQGDLVVIYTKLGEYRTRQLSTGKTAHFYYWSLSDPIWENAHRGVLVLHAPSWESRPADEIIK